MDKLKEYSFNVHSQFLLVKNNFMIVVFENIF